MGGSVPSPDEISADEFTEYLERYPSCVEAISASKGAKPGQKTLVELDEYRYTDAIAKFSSPRSKDPMTLDEVKILVEWKLRHGTFRPTLMNLVSSNDAQTVKSTVAKAITAYRANSDVSAALTILTQLKGIGPATASLLLAIHDAEKAIFFADEAFYWLCLGGVKGSIKYNAKEYAALNKKARGLCERLDVKAVDVERVAFVLMKEGAGEAKGKGEKVKAEVEEVKSEVKEEKRRARGERKAEVEGGEEKKGKAKGKRKAEESENVKTAPTRRSKRGKQS
ncbi:hypothetical protein B0T14DRAFT_532393 [Immersiella caudata]|uniref:Uncharacterized protein n=1 Tax=Immersiella caudata TaxID=314043 RepID=A0AA39XEN1_9PEZI|nr:hypothetical protein B0T14DRAFT_532393 [Immersiella caudata]